MKGGFSGGACKTKGGCWERFSNPDIEDDVHDDELSFMDVDEDGANHAIGEFVARVLERSGDLVYLKAPINRWDRWHELAFPKSD